MVSIEEIKDSGILTNLTEHTKFPFVELNDYNGEPGVIVYDENTVQEDDERYIYFDLTYDSFDPRFTNEYLQELGIGIDWDVYAVFPPSDEEMPYVVLRPMDDGMHPDMDNIRMVDGILCLDDDAWYM